MKENKSLQKEDFHLTPRQLEVLKHLAHGLRNKEIAFQMKKSESTVKQHISGMMLRMGVNTRTGIVIEAQKLGLIDIDKE